MDIISDIILNLILMVFPILVYFIYNCYRELKGEQYNNLLLNVSLVSSMYLCFKYGNVENNMQILLFCNLPIVVAYLKEQYQVGILLSIVVVCYAAVESSISVGILGIKFVSYFLVYLMGKKKRIRDNTFIILIAVLQGFFVSFEYFYSFRHSDLVTLVEIIVLMLLFYVLPFVLLYLFRLGDQITTLHLTVSELEKDKQIRNSLFKITHEVKNPIAVCKGYLDMINVHDEEQVGRYVPIIKREIERSLDIMSDFMEFSKIKIDKEIIDVNLLLEDIEDEFQLLIHSKDIAFDCKFVNDEIYIEGDYNRLKQVFVNLVKNSLESIEEKGSIKIMTHAMRDYYYIEVIDDGCGMDEYTLSKVKEMFFTTKVKGSGLGVSLSNEIIKAHDGSIEYQSKLGKGTKVVVKLPIIVL